MESLTLQQLQRSCIKVQGNLITIGSQPKYPRLLTDIVKKNYKKRQKIHEFTLASQKRLKRKIATIKFNNSLFITLTAREDFSFEKVRIFLKRIYKLIGKKVVIWKKELQQRGVVHYHLLVLNTRAWIDHKWITDNWSEIIGEGSITNIKMVVRGKMGVYLAKYVCKGVDNGILDCSSITGGRYWGIENRKYIILEKVHFQAGYNMDDFILAYGLRLINWCKEKEYNFSKVSFVWWDYKKGVAL